MQLKMHLESRINKNNVINFCFSEKNKNSDIKIFFFKKGKLHP